jgi:hypothetical protein
MLSPRRGQEKGRDDPFSPHPVEEIGLPDGKGGHGAPKGALQELVLRYPRNEGEEEEEARERGGKPKTSAELSGRSR